MTPSDRTVPIFRIHCQIRGTEPPIWRSVQVPADLHLDSLHDVLQAAMDWFRGHSWQFSVGDHRYRASESKPRGRLLVYPEPKAPPSTMVQDIFRLVGDTVLYTYDRNFSEGWEIDLRLESIQDPDPKLVYPRCVAGELAAPPDHCGSLGEFDELKAILTDPGHPEYEETREMLPEGWNASVCDLALINVEIPTPKEICRGSDDPDAEGEAEAAALAAIIEIRVRNEQHELLGTLLVEHPTAHPGPAAALDRAAPHKKGRVIRAEQRIWNHFLELLESQQESDDFQRAKQARELRALIAETR